MQKKQKDAASIAYAGILAFYLRHSKYILKEKQLREIISQYAIIFVV